MSRHHELTDEEWALLAPLLPPDPPRGGRWRNLPDRFGPWKTVYQRKRRWAMDGTWKRILAQLQARADGQGLITWDVSVDSTVARAHQHAAGAAKRGHAKGPPQLSARSVHDEGT